MDAVDYSEHYEVTTADETPSLLSVIIDTNPRAWAVLDDGSLPLSLTAAVANLLLFINAHLAFSGANQVAVIAAHVNRAVWLYPSSHSPKPIQDNTSADGDVAMADAPAAATTPSSANKYPQFAQIEATVLGSLKKLMAETTERDLDSTTTQLSGALTLALCHTNKASRALGASDTAIHEAAQTSGTTPPSPMKGRILVLSVSDSESSQYIPTMNAVFAAAHGRVAIDALALAGDATFLQQACFNTGGVFLRAANPQGLLAYLMFGLVADTEAREALVAPTHDTVDFRAACFCHGNVVDTGFVCSICLSIFCELPDNAECFTCGTKLALGSYGAKPAVIPRKKKKKKKIINGSGREETMSATGTPLR
ncbi:transcription factor TFIIH subunit Tfb4 [Cordyceps militaris CM01]|uniref:General transcription and DNA repair factor IIH subunit TFB4 n=2 Tax=Cordyceps militaris TaxID=73501 RepID=G3J9Y7_CORMM|nr:transcription factor TFIIH subunit Tfb4 [Cordyceps militaris CM01]ATY60924.1 transcription factor TFIIH subunit Tfb4 [Cordyceps militaris]EGX94210.1 transcription factor TFIIH subunit Tfb4 [Cordyceps militaris CM01]